MTIQDAIARIADNENLTRDDAAQVLKHIMTGECTPAQIGGFLIGLRTKGETVEEITGLAATMREMATPIITSRYPMVDTCGTGGDQSGTFNISTTAAFVVAGANVAVAKHGNRSASSQCGSADVLEALGVNLDSSPEKVGQCVDEIGIGFLFARALHGAMKHVAVPRSELKTRTVFNILGPLTNPAGADRQVIGIFDRSRVEEIAKVLGNLGAKRAFVVAGNDGLDEITLCDATRVAELRDGDVQLYEITPEEVGLERAELDTLKGGYAEENAEILTSVLKGNPGPATDIVLFNAAAALQAADVASNWKDGVDIARQSIVSGAALGKLNDLVRITQDASS
ncbi:MAG: anthranilate phosphoribosyltransferase [Candidatus Hydrogenedentota bacterium]|nr:MAG: anthranilate phosphoribosyltransferase [Candidatus Hydrogenedentota bacterium]